MMQTPWAHSPKETGQPEPLLEHLELVAQLAESFAGRFNAGSWGRAAGLWHDLGKFSREFQAYIRGQLTPGMKVDHSTAGAQYAHQYAGQIGQVLAYCIAGHHGGLPDYHRNPDNTLLQGTPLSERLTKALPVWLPYVPADLLTFKPVQSLLITIDKEEALYQISFLVRILYSALVDADFLATESFLDARKSRQREPGAPIAELAAILQVHLDQLQALAKSSEVNRLRREILANCLAAAAWPPGLFSLTVPTGGGKTLASLMFALRHAMAHGMERVIVVVPYISIIEQTAEIYREVFCECPGATIVEHHSIADYERDGAPLSIRLATENWDGTIIVTTAVQFYDSLYAAKPSKCRKLHRIARSVVILDEAQTLPVGLLGPCLSALRALVHGYQTSVVLCTATQPAFCKRPDFAPGLLGVREIMIMPEPVALYNAMRRVKVTCVGAMSDAILLAKLATHQQVLCVVNTTKHAARLAAELEHLPGTYHLSARMCPRHRLERLVEMKARLKAGEPCRVVSTQVIEAGVDVDFPIVYRALCGLDSLAQAAGRCNREGQLLEFGQVIFFLGEEPPVNALKAAADACLQILPDYIGDPLSLEAIDHFFRQYYWARGNYDTKEILPLLTARGADKIQFQFRSAAAEFALIDSPTQSVIIPWQVEGVDLCAALRQPDLLDQPWRVAKLARVAQRYSVNIWPDEFAQLRDTGRIGLVHGEWWLLRDLTVDYSPVTGLVRRDVSGDVLQEIG
jgi:CRISPR-associated endonuclease/helicase Cas3